jgi:anti-sigma B factor antagonist
VTAQGQGLADLLEVTNAGGVRVVAFRKPVDLTADGVPECRPALDAHARDATAMVLDLGNVRFMDSAGVGTVVVLHRTLLRGGGELRLARPSREVAAVFELLRLHRLLEIHATVDEAVASFAEGLA